MGVKGVSVNLLNTLVDMTEGRLLREGGGGHHKYSPGPGGMRMTLEERICER